jgi:hypothetical protein
VNYDPAAIARARLKLSPLDRAELDEHLRHAAPAPDFLDPAFAEQTAFILDPSKLKALLATRRSGKSFAAGRYLLKDAYETPGCSVLYVGLTRESAKRTMIKDVLLPLDEKLKLGCEYNKADLTLTLPNKSVVYVLGLDSNDAQKRKVFGQKFRLVIIDEAALYSIDLRELVYSVLQPAIADYRGTICLMGMPSNNQRGLFFDLTQGQESTKPGTWTHDDMAGGARWSGHRWSAWQNPYMADKWEAEISAKKAINPLIDLTPMYQQEYLGRWTVDDSKLVYRYRPTFNDFDTLPRTQARWNYVLGIDLGYNDDSAFVVVAYHDQSPVLYIVDVYKAPEMIIPDVAAKIREFEATYSFDKIIIDGSAKQAVETMRRMYSLSLTPADKSGKWDFIQMMNGDFLSQRILLGPAAQPLTKEYAKLIKDPRSDIPREKDGLPNHAADAALYAWRHCYHYLSQTPAPPTTYGSPEWAQAEQQRMEDRAINRIIDRKQDDEWMGW